MRAITNLSDQRRSLVWSAVLVVVCAVILSLGVAALYHVGTAHADPVVDAGVVVIDAGATVPPAPVPAVLHDPSVDLPGFVTDVETLWHTGGWAVGLLLLLVGALELAAALGKRTPALAWLGKGRVSIAIGGALAVFTAVLNAAIGSGQWASALTALIAGVLAFWHQAGTDPAKA